MTEDDIIKMAQKAGLIIDGNNSGDDDLFAFAAVVFARAAALEREACAKLCEDNGLFQTCEAIRARGTP